MPVVLRVATLILMSIVPGGMFMVAGWVAYGMVAEGMRREQGSQPVRFVRAVKSIQWRDVMSHTRRLV
jgi:hypothetical protein